MFELEKIFTFEAGHVLSFHDGKCAVPHGHSYVLYVYLQKDTLIESGPKKNMVLDFTDVSKVVKPMIDEFFDHRWLNDTLQSDSPTVEFIAQWIYEYLEPKLPGLQKVSLQETPTSKATYSKR